MRISDWSSDVCFSDLTLPRSNLPACSKVAPRDIPTVSPREGRSQDWVHCLQLARHEDQPASRKIALRPVSRNRTSRLLPGTNSRAPCCCSYLAFGVFLSLFLFFGVYIFPVAGVDTTIISVFSS